MANGREKSKTLTHFKIRGVPFGIYTWKRRGGSGIIVRCGPLGHLQIQQFRCQIVGRQRDGRRGKHGVKVSAWGIRGRRRKRSVELAVHL